MSFGEDDLFSVDEEDDEDFSSDDDDDDDDDGEVAALPNVAERARNVMNQAASRIRPKGKPAGGGAGRSLRIRPMPPTMRQKYPGALSILFTNDNGKQLMLIRK